MKVFKNFLNRFSGEKDLATTIRNSGYYFGSSVVGIAVSFVTFPLYAILLTKEQFGILAFFSAIGNVLTPFSILSLTNYYIVRSGELSGDEKKALFNDLVLFNLMWNSVLILTGGGILYLYLELSAGSVEFFPNALLMFLILITQSFITFKSVQYRMDRSGLRFFLLQILQVLGNAVLGLSIVWIFNAGATGKLIGIAISNIVAAVTFGHETITNFIRIDMARVKKGLLEMKELTIASFLHSTVPSADVLVLERYNNLTGLGEYSVGKQIANFVGMAGSSLFQAFEPKIYEDTRHNGFWRSKNFIVFFGLNILLLLLYFAFSDLIIAILTAGRFQTSLQYSNLLVFQAFSASIIQALQIKLYVERKVKLIAILNVLGSALTFILIFPLTSDLLYQGAAISFLIASIFQLLLTLILMMYNGKS